MKSIVVIAVIGLQMNVSLKSMTKAGDIVVGTKNIFSVTTVVCASLMNQKTVTTRRNIDMRLIVDIDEEVYEAARKSKLPHFGLSSATIEAVKSGEKVTGMEPIIPYEDSKKIENTEEETTDTSQIGWMPVILGLLFILLIIGLIVSILIIFEPVVAVLTVDKLVSSTGMFIVAMFIVVLIWKVIKHFLYNL